MTYISLYRKYRSKTFDEIIEQKPIITTLKNAIINSRIPHAYLFSGPRGTGKTSVARIFAKALNCSDKPTPNPCGKCDQCTKIASGQALNVMEIDAASNRGIDEIRDLREKIKYKPVEGRYKVYIMDEAHMLTNEAFNALLKTLEDPPQNTIFILATTEPQKIPVTIASRCQRFDFGRIKAEKIEEHLKNIASNEKVSITDEALNLISRQCEGSLRDAISLLDQLVSFCGSAVTAEDVVSVLGTAQPEFLFGMAQSICETDEKNIFDCVERAYLQGISVPQLTKDLVYHFRNMMIAKVGSENILELTKEQIARLKEDSGKYSLALLKNTVKILSNAEVDMKWHPNSRLVLEVALLNIIEGTDEQMMQPKATPPSPRLKARGDSLYNDSPSPSGEGLGMRPLAGSAKNPIKNETAEFKITDENLVLIKSKWSDVMAKMKEKSLFGFVSLQEADPDQIDGSGFLVLKFKKGYSFHRSRIEQKTNKEAVELCIKEIVNLDVPIKCILSDLEPEKPTSKIVSAEDIVDIFDGRIVN